MDQNKLTFESENLAVDYLTFNIEKLVEPTQIKEIMNQFSKSFNFNVRNF
jgi:hypothetical protein